MNKKSFKKSFDDLLGGNSIESRKESREKSIVHTKATFVIRHDHLDKLRAISYMERTMIKSVLENALSLYISKYEKENGDIVLPKNKATK